ncbi:MAP7 domain-containing protein 3 isoform 3-T3 [Liasis olivaceus]
MAEGSGGGAPPGVPVPPPPPPTLRGLREQMVAAAQALAEERRNQGGVSTVSLQSPISTKSKPVIDGSLLKSEERQRLAKERREERERQHAAKETQLLEKEKKAKLQYEKQLEEKQKKLREQKLKEQQRRAAVEQKRKQKIEEEKEHYEAVVHRTLERSQRLETRQKRWSWGGSVTDPDGKSEAPAVAEANKRSSSTVDLKQPETVLHKHLSSSAALLNSPSRGSAKRSSSLNRLNNKTSLNSEQGLPNALQTEQKGEPEKKRSSSLSRMSSKLPELENVQKEEKTGRRLVSPLESNSISRLLAPTQASLARSKSAATLSADGKDPAASTNLPAHVPKVPLRSRSTDRLKGTAASSENVSLESTQKPEPAKQPPTSAGRRALSPSLSGPRRSISPGNVGKHPPSPAAIRRKPHPVSPNVLRHRQSPPITVSKPAPIQRLPLTPNVLIVTKKKTDTECKPNDAVAQEQGAVMHALEREVSAGPSKTKEESPASFTFLPELPSSIFSPSSPAASSFCSQDFPPASSVARRMLFGYDPMSRMGASSHSLSGAPNPSQADLTGRDASPSMFPPCFASMPNLGRPPSARGAAGGFPPNFVLEATRHGDGVGVSPLRCISFPCSRRTGSLTSPPFSRRGPAQRPVSMTTDPFVLNKLLHTFQAMRCSVDYIGQELRVLNSHLASLSHHFGALPTPGYFSQPEEKDLDYPE